MAQRKLVQVLLLFCFISAVSVSTIVLARRQLASLRQELGGAGVAPGRVTATASPPSALLTVTRSAVTRALVATMPSSETQTAPTLHLPTSPSPARTRMGIVNSAVVNVRSHPSLGGEVVGQVKQGDRLEILATSPDGQWLQVCCPLGTREGTRQSWVAADLINVQP